MTTTKTPVIPEIGMGATSTVGSDRSPYTITAVSPSGKQITVQRDEVMIVNPDGLGNGDYVTMPNPKAPEQVYTLRSNGRWIMKGSPMTAWWLAIYPGTRDYYRDPHF